MEIKRNQTSISVGPGAAISSPQSSAPKISVNGKPIQTLGDRSVELVFVIDTTGSMSGRIDALLAMCEQFVIDFAKENIPFRIAIVGFGDLTVEGDKISVSPFVSDLPTIQRLLRKLPRTDGGSNAGESSLEALRAAHNLPFKPNSIRAIVLMTDDLALQHDISAESVINEYLTANCLAFVFSIRTDYYVRLAELTGGSWCDISSASSLGDIIAALRGIARTVIKTVDNVLRVSGGDVKQYRQLGKG